MATQLSDNLFVSTGYLDKNISVNNITELIDKYNFDGQSVHMPQAFMGINSVTYPLDFWLVPNNGDVKWEVNNIPSLETEADLSMFLAFINDFKSQSGYYPLHEGSKVVALGIEYSFNLNENGEPSFISTQEIFDETISDAIKLAVDEVTSGASEAFDTLREIEDWIKNNSGTSIDTSNLVTKDELAEEIAKIEIPSLDGYATESYVKTAIAEAQLSGGTDIDLSGYATKDDIKDLAKKTDIISYTSGTGISIEDNKINVLIETGDTENRNYIKVNEDNSISVEEIGLDDAVTTEDIQVNGGAWASAIQDIYGDTIPVGTSFQDFLKAMSCKEYFIENITTSSSFTVTCGDIKPNLTGAKSNEIVEVGTEITLGEIKGNETKARQSLNVSGFEYGYKLGENGTHINSKVYSETPIAIASGETGNKLLRVNFTKFSNTINGGNTIATKTGQNYIGQTTMYVQEGQNSVSISQTGDTYVSNTVLTAGTIYIATNLKNYYKSDKVTPNTFIPSFPILTKTATASTTYVVTGAHKYYVGDIQESGNDYWNTDRSSVVINLEEQNWATASTITVPYTFKVGTKQQTVVVPSTYTSVSGKDVNNGDVTFNLIKTITLINEKGFKSQYNVFVAPVLDGLTVESFITITIKK